MSVYIVTGTHGVGKSTVIALAVKKRPFKVVTYGDVMFDIAKAGGLVKAKDEMRSRIGHEKYKEIQKAAARKIAAMGDVLVDTHCSILAGNGYIPGLPEWVLAELKPTAIVIIEGDPKDVEKRRKEDKTRMRSDLGGRAEMEEHQAMNRAYAAAYSALSGARVKIIRNEQGKAEKAAERLLEVLA
jgi:adenylate kinase